MFKRKIINGSSFHPRVRGQRRRPLLQFSQKHGAQGKLSELLYLVISPLNFENIILLLNSHALCNAIRNKSLYLVFR